MSRKKRAKPLKFRLSQRKTDAWPPTFQTVFKAYADRVQAKVDELDRELGRIGFSEHYQPPPPEKEAAAQGGSGNALVLESNAHPQNLIA